MTGPVSNAGLLPLLRQFVGFAGVGIVGTLVHYSILVGLVELAGVGPVPATMAGSLGGALVNYRLSRRYVFRSDRPHGEALSRFLLVAGVGFGLNAALVALGVRGLGGHYLLVQVLATGTVLLWNYAANRWWTFRERPVLS